MTLDQTALDAHIDAVLGWAKWDKRFLELCTFVSQWSKDPSTKTGAVIVRPDRTVASVGYNGFPSRMRDDEELWNDRPTKYSRVVHCEMNALLHAHESVEGYTLYTTGMSCDRCLVHQIEAGIERFVWWEDTEDMKSRWADAFERSWAFMTEAGVMATEVQR